jgi:hypothetical protein
MYNLNDIEMSRQLREDVTRQVENNRLARQLRAARPGVATGTGDALLKRIFAWFPRKGQAVEC